MKNALKTSFWVIFLLLTEAVYAQKEILPLKIGDKIPDIVIKHILNSNKDIQLKSLHQQELLIINFWATWCVPCIKELPMIDSLVVAYPNNLKVLSVSYESDKTVKKFFKSHPDISTNHILIMTGDSVLIQYFRHRVIPHNVWIDKRGVIVNITGSEEISSVNIIKFITKGSLDVENKKDLIKFDMHQTFHLKDSDFVYRSIVSGYTNGINGGSSLQGAWYHPTERWLIRIFSFNQSRQQLLWQAYNRVNNYYDYYGIMKILTPDSTRFFWPEQCRRTYALSKYKSRQEWIKNNCYCYELALPNAVIDTTFFQYMLNDLQRTFQVLIYKKFETIPVCYLTIKPDHNFERVQNDSSYINLDSSSLRVHNMTILHLFQYLNETVKKGLNDKPLDPPYVNSTGISFPIDLQITFNKPHPDYSEIKEMIEAKYGINYRIEKKPFPIIYIQDLVPKN
jgi:thiol-disulfide isomerase/thioredoxin